MPRQVKDPLRAFIVMETIYIKVQNKHHRRGKFAAFMAN